MEKKIMYRTGSRWISSKIEPFEVVAETTRQVTYLINGVERKESKITEYHRWHESKDAAIKFLVSEYEAVIRESEQKILDAKAKIETLSKI